MRLQAPVGLFSGSLAVQLLDAVRSGSVIEIAAVVVGSVVGMALTACSPGTGSAGSRLTTTPLSTDRRSRSSGRRRRWARPLRKPMPRMPSRPLETDARRVGSCSDARPTHAVADFRRLPPDGLYVRAAARRHDRLSTPQSVEMHQPRRPSNRRRPGHRGALPHRRHDYEVGERRLRAWKAGAVTG